MLMPGRLRAPTPCPPSPCPASRNQSIYGTPAYAWGYFGVPYGTPTTRATQQRDYYYDWVQWTFRHGN
jgi:hypothetical protein